MKGDACRVRATSRVHDSHDQQRERPASRPGEAGVAQSGAGPSQDGPATPPKGGQAGAKFGARQLHLSCSVKGILPAAFMGTQFKSHYTGFDWNAGRLTPSLTGTLSATASSLCHASLNRQSAFGSLGRPRPASGRQGRQSAGVAVAAGQPPPGRREGGPEGAGIPLPPPVAVSLPRHEPELVAPTRAMRQSYCAML